MAARPRLPLARSGEPRWSPPARWAVLAIAALLNTRALSINEWANTYYSAAVLGMTQSWKAFFYGAMDAGSFITVDKPPLALWLQALSARVFGFNTWSLLLPQAIAGVVAVWVVQHVVRRSSGPLAGVVAGLALAVTPIAVVMARHNNPDTLLGLLLVLALWAASNAIRSSQLLPLVWCAVAVGLAFNTKMLQAFFVVPVIAAVYLVAARPKWTRKLRNLGVAGVVLAAVSLSWMLVVDLVPASARPYVGGSTNNTVLDLLLGYNGFGRVEGQAQIMSPGMMGGGGSPGGGPPPGGAMPRGGMPGGPGGGMDDAGLTRLFSGEVAPQIGWLFPLALLGAVAVIVHLRRRPRHDAQRADFLLWAGTLLVTAVVFTFASGTWHTYYVVALAAPLAAVVGMGVIAMWRLARDTEWWGLLLPASITTTGLWSAHLLGQNDDFLPWMGTIVAVVTLVAGVAMAIPLVLLRDWRGRKRPFIAAGALVGVLASLAGPTAYAVTPLSTPVGATFPSAGPSGGAHGGPGGGRTADGGGRGNGAQPNALRPGGMRGGGEGGERSSGELVSSQLIRYLTDHHEDETWLVAVVGSMVAAPVILETGQPVMAIGGYNGNDPTPTVEEVERHVADGELRYVWTSGSSGVRSMGGEVDTAVVDASMGWVAQHCAIVDPAAYGGDTTSTTHLYDCRGAA
ncbi:glycosyl transferase family 39 [Saccharopolyspora aridisoli]|uniref:Glycosyl transferase family 39 n=1 Tax=Saccharopolyspora aridisoli TaxID=2530385 RepID=A0A4R4UEK5_9PSEU|nr:glycosyltransferase family 39 protein [Saccharopolyspora aridisoli]TDC90117.1 glycosyl transferase family 39 [Saccharopolyspora aridisoli]